MDILTCSECDRSYPGQRGMWRCSCGHRFRLEISRPGFFNPKDLRSQNRPHSLWRYKEALPPLRADSIVSLGEGGTPLTPTRLWNAPIHVKQDHLCPTGSFKDRGASVMLSRLKEVGRPEIIEDSSGNAGCSIAAYAAAVNIRSKIFVPATTAPGKLIQIRSHGAEVHQISGSRQATAEAALNLASRTQTYYASHCWDPYFFEGTKTVAFELWEDLHFKAPDTLILPVGNGTLFLGAFLGFQELLQAELIDRLPRLIGVQTETCCPLFTAFHKIKSQTPQAGPSLAAGIAISSPLRAKEILSAATASKGTLLTVNEREIAEGFRQLSSQGFFVEPTSAVSSAGFKKLLASESSLGVVATVLTGHGLKSVPQIEQLLSLP